MELWVNSQKDIHPSPLMQKSPFKTIDNDYPPLCASSDPKLQLCKVSSVSIHQYRRNSANKKYGRTDGWTDRQGDSLVNIKKLVWEGGIKTSIYKKIKKKSTIKEISKRLQGIVCVRESSFWEAYSLTSLNI